MTVPIYSGEIIKNMPGTTFNPKLPNMRPPISAPDLKPIKPFPPRKGRNGRGNPVVDGVEVVPPDTIFEGD